MNRYIHRVLALFLVPGLIFDPVMASTGLDRVAGRHASLPLHLFASQALGPAPGHFTQTPSISEGATVCEARRETAQVRSTSEVPPAAPPVVTIDEVRAFLDRVNPIL